MKQWFAVSGGSIRAKNFDAASGAEKIRSCDDFGRIYRNNIAILVHNAPHVSNCTKANR
jgi:hypothetical protein